jgi:hypothetical protein
MLTGLFRDNAAVIKIDKADEFVVGSPASLFLFTPSRTTHRKQPSCGLFSNLRRQVMAEVNGVS